MGAKFDVPGVGAAVAEFLDHCLSVKSALLFGPLVEGHDSPAPFAGVDQHRVLDVESKRDLQGELYPVLQRIVGVLKDTRPEFICLCVGPDQPVVDDVVDPWTILIDQHLARATPWPRSRPATTGRVAR